MIYKIYSECVLEQMVEDHILTQEIENSRMTETIAKL